MKFKHKMYLKKNTKFIYRNNKKEQNVVLIPGWATDCRIFYFLSLNQNCFVPVSFYPLDFTEKLKVILNQKEIDNISIIGWSMGGFVAANFASVYPEMVDKLILISIREKFKKKEIKNAKIQLKRNKKKYLTNFYSKCFCNQKNFEFINEKLLQSYIRSFSLSYLQETLDFLGTSRIDVSLFNKLKSINFIHGEEDEIAPVHETICLNEKIILSALFKIKNTGHFPFLNKEVKKIISNVLS